jgi:hypothetical protein
MHKLQMVIKVYLNQKMKARPPLEFDMLDLEIAAFHAAEQQRNFVPHRWQQR